jgi:hypothetical protein
MANKSFDINQLTITLISTTAGISHIVSGLAKDTSVSVAMDEELFNYDNDAHGNITTYKNNNYNAKLTLTLHQSSPTNDVLSTFSNIDRGIGLGAGFSVLIKDNNSPTLISSAYSKVLSMGNIEFGTTASNRTWTILLGDAATFVGGLSA